LIIDIFILSKLSNKVLKNLKISSIKMLGYGEKLLKDVKTLFENYEEEIMIWKTCNLKVILDKNSNLEITGEDVLEELIETKRILENMKIYLYIYYEDEYIQGKKAQKYMIFNLEDYYISKDRRFIYEVEIEEYLNVVNIKIEEYNKLNI